MTIGGNRRFAGEELLPGSCGEAQEVLQDGDCPGLMTEFVRNRPELWNEEIVV